MEVMVDTVMVDTVMVGIIHIPQTPRIQLEVRLQDNVHVVVVLENAPHVKALGEYMIGGQWVSYRKKNMTRSVAYAMVVANVEYAMERGQ